MGTTGFEVRAVPDARSQVELLDTISTVTVAIGTMVIANWFAGGRP